MAAMSDETRTELLSVRRSPPQSVDLLAFLSDDFDSSLDGDPTGRRIAPDTLGSGGEGNAITQAINYINDFNPEQNAAKLKARISNPSVQEAHPQPADYLASIFSMATDEGTSETPSSSPNSLDDGRTTIIRSRNSF